MNDIVNFELDNWVAGKDYPDAEPFKTWMSDYVLQFSNKEWDEQNELCVVAGLIDMSICFHVSAKKEWVEKNCPELLTKYRNFIKTPEDELDDSEEFPENERRWQIPFIKWNINNIGLYSWDEDEEKIYKKVSNEDDDRTFEEVDNIDWYW